MSIFEIMPMQSRLGPISLEGVMAEYVNKKAPPCQQAQPDCVRHFMKVPVFCSVFYLHVMGSSQGSGLFSLFTFSIGPDTALPLVSIHPTRPVLPHSWQDSPRESHIPQSTQKLVSLLSPLNPNDSSDISLYLTPLKVCKVVAR